MIKTYSTHQEYLDDLFANDEIGFAAVMRRNEDLRVADKPEDEALAQAIYEYQEGALDGS